MLPAVLLRRSRISRARAAWTLLKGGSVVYGVRVQGTIETPRNATYRLGCVEFHDPWPDISFEPLDCLGPRVHWDVTWERAQGTPPRHASQT